MDDSHNDLCWRDLAVSVAGKILLNDCHGIARAGRLMGILGPSGAGKSTLLSALSGTLQRCYHVSGHIWSNHGRRVGVSEGTVALLAQDDPFFLELTVFETLCYASRLAGQSYAQAQQEADSLLQRVGLAAASSRRVDHTTKGEQRRLAVACAIAGEGQEGRGFSARALLADEPTTGLDAFQAQRVAELLKELAVTRKCVAMCSLHQPRSSMWRCLEDLLVMAPGGFVVYCGRTSEMPNYFSSLGHSCAEGAVNPAEFVIDLVSIDHESQTQAMKDRLRIEKLDFSWRRTSENLVPLSFRKVASLKSWKRSMKRSSTRALMLLVKRAMLQMGRDHLTNALRLLATAGLALVFGLHFGRLDGGGLPTARSVAARICLVSFGVIAMAMLAMARAVDRFAKERAIVHRERLSRCYSGFVYLLSKAVTELPLDALAAALFAAILHHVCGMHARREEVVMAFSLVAVASSSLGLAVGALAPSAERAMAIGGPVMIVHMLTGVIDPAGQVGHSDGQFMEMMQRLSPIRYAIEALCVAELGGLDLARSAAEAPRMGGLALVKSGDEVLRRLGITNDFEASTDWLLRLSALHLFIAAVALAAQPQVAQLEVNHD